MIEKPHDKRGKEISGKKSLNWGVILSFCFGFVGVLYADIRYGLYCALIFVGCAALMISGLLLTNVIAGLGMALALLGCLTYLAYYILCICVTVNTIADQNYKWLRYEEQLTQLCEEKTEQLVPTQPPVTTPENNS